jgi:hypothetical protein
VSDLVAGVTHLVEVVSVRAKWRQLRRTVATMEKGLSRAFATQGRLLRQGTRVLEARASTGSATGYVLREAWSVDDWLTIFDRIANETRTMFFEPVQLGSQAAMTLAAQSLIAELAVDTAFLLRNPRAVAYLQQHGYGLISQIDAVTRGNIATIVSNGVAEGWSYDRVAKEISSLYSEMAVGKPQLHIDSRAHLIAVTESGNAYEAGNSIVVADLQDAGLQMQKKWLTVGDERVSDGCEENEAQGWIPFAQSFQSGHMQPLRFPGCRCTTLYRRRPDDD